MNNKTTEQRFLEKIKINDITGCWEWTGYIHESGYGQFTVFGHPHRAHRISYELHRGIIPAGKIVLHVCDNRSCVNPKHLKLGTHEQNMKDMTNKFRQAIGSGNGKSKLTESQAKEIKTSNKSLSRLSKLFGVSTTCIADIKNGKTWRHI